MKLKTFKDKSFKGLHNHVGGAGSPSRKGRGYGGGGYSDTDGAKVVPQCASHRVGFRWGSESWQAGRNTNHQAFDYCDREKCEKQLTLLNLAHCRRRFAGLLPEHSNGD